MVNYTVFTLIKKKRQQVTDYNGNCWKCVCVCTRVRFHDYFYNSQLHLIGIPYNLAFVNSYVTNAMPMLGATLSRLGNIPKWKGFYFVH